MLVDVCQQHQEHDALIAAGRQRLPDPDAMREVADYFDALGNPTRLTILYALAGGELCTCDLARIAELSVSAISHQLRILRDRRLLVSRKEGKNVFYRLRDEHVADLLRVALDHQREDRRHG